MSKLNEKDFVGGIPKYYGGEPLWKAIQLHTAECVAQAVGEAVKGAIVPDWKAHIGCRGARIIYEYGNFGDVSWVSEPAHKDCNLRLRNGGRIHAGAWYINPSSDIHSVGDNELRKRINARGVDISCRIGMKLSRSTLEAMAVDLGISLTVEE